MCTWLSLFTCVRTLIGKAVVHPPIGAEFFGENITYNIVPDSIRTIYGGFKGTKSSKAKAPSGGDSDKKAT